MNFDTFCEDVARRFVQTVMVVDDRARLSPPEAMPSPPDIRLPGGRGFAPGRSGTGGTAASGSGPSVASAPEESHGLDGLRLTRSFARLGAACSIYVPETNELSDGDDVRDTVAVARHADVVVLDWKLGSTSNKARAIIRRMLDGDTAEGGRLRLIAVYTGETGLPAIRDTVRQELDVAGVAVEASDIGGAVALVGRSLRIVFVNKVHAATPIGTPGVDESALPETLVTEFARMARGIMPAVALGSIAAVREASHHVLAKFHAELDGALAAHRALLATPEDAETYATDLVAEELRAFLEATGVGPAHAGIEVFGSWVTALEASGHKFVPSPETTQGLAAAGVQNLLRLGKEGHKEAAAAFRPPRSAGKLHEFATALFYADPASAEAANLEFSRMAALKREAYGGRYAPDRWIPTLTLGTILVLRDDPERFFACIQPVCDAVRLTNSRRFPLVPLGPRSSAERFSLVVKIRHDTDVRLEPDYHPHALLHESFAADPLTRTVRAKWAFGRFVFETEAGALYEWLGDLRASVAQRLVQRSAGQVDRVGLDEYEWLRLKGGAA